MILKHLKEKIILYWQDCFESSFRFEETWQSDGLGGISVTTKTTRTSIAIEDSCEKND